MRYTYNGGIESNWRAKAEAVITHLRSKYWLPVAIGGITLAWLGLLLIDIQKPFFNGTGSASKPGSSHGSTNPAAATTSGSQVVSFKTSDPTLVVGHQSSHPVSSPAGGGSLSTVTSSPGGATSVTTLPVTSDPVGGVTPPATTDPVTDPGDGTVTVPPVTTPVVDTPPITVDPTGDDTPVSL